MELIYVICFGLVCAGTGAVLGALTNRTGKDRDIMADIATLIALARQNNEQARKIREEVIGMRDRLNGRIAALEEQIAKLTITPEQLAALEAELTGAKDVIAEIDELNADAAAPGEGTEPAKG